MAQSLTVQGASRRPGCAPNRSVFVSAGGVPHRIGSTVQGWEGPCRSVGGPVPGARRVSPAPPIEPARIPYSPPSRSVRGRETAPFAPSSGGCPCQGPGDRTWSRQTSTPAHHRREATAREEPVRANRRKAAHSEGCTQAPGRRPSTRSGDACRDWLWKLAGLTPVLRSI